MVAAERRLDGVPRPASVAFRPRPGPDGAEIWRLRCAERPPSAASLPAGVAPSATAVTI